MSIQVCYFYEKSYSFKKISFSGKQSKWKYLKNILYLSLVAFFSLFEFICFSFDYKIANFNDFNEEKIYNKKITFKNNYCFFEKFDIWSDIVQDHITPQKKFENCKKIHDNKYYKLINGVITVTRKDLFCFYGCKYSKDDFKITFSPYIYINQSYKLDCDIFHFRCYNRSNAIIYDDVNFHVNKLNRIPKESTPFLEENFSIPINNKRYDVHIYVIDSLSYYHALRALPKTRKFLKEKLNGVEMEYLNVIGPNSRVNAYGFLLNKQNLDIDDFYYNNKTKKNDFGNLDSCKIYLDNKTYIQEYYRRMGYVTLDAEDSEYDAIFTYKNCAGFKNEPTHHSLKPLQALWSNLILEKIVSNKLKKKCYHHGFHIMDYMSDFLKKYKNNLKMSLMWQSKIVHNSLNYIFAADEIYYKFFEKNEKYFKNSFTILIGDHGNNMNKLIKYDIGKYEQKNPYFIITIPEELRSNEELVKNLKENSKKHISHFDIYATLLDILTNAPKDGFKMLDKQKKFPIRNDTTKGLSLLRPLPIYNRNCYEMSVPLQYCLCRPHFEPLPSYMVMERSKLEKNFIKALNNKLVEGNLTDKCAEMSLDKSEEFIIKFAKGGNSKMVYQLDAVTIPGKARYRAIMTHNFEVMNNEILRLNIFRHQAEVCEKFSFYRLYCYCKILLHKI